MPLSITGGRFKGSVLKTPSGKNLTRPTSGKVRQALFNVLRGRVEDGDFLDLYAGSGAVGLEALSRGSRRVVLVENHPAAFKALETNCRLLMERGAPGESLTWIRQDARAFCSGNGGRDGGKGPATESDNIRRFDVVFADPPFDRDFSELWGDVSPLLKEGGLAVLQYPSRNPPEWTSRADRILTYGESSLALFEGSGSGEGC